MLYTYYKMIPILSLHLGLLTLECLCEDTTIFRWTLGPAKYSCSVNIKELDLLGGEAIINAV